jgi:hypothetical protein
VRNTDGSLRPARHREAVWRRLASADFYAAMRSEPSIEMDSAAIRRTLLLRVGEAGDTGTVAANTFATWQQVASQLVPVIGARGVDALFRRSLHLTSKAFPWLALAGNGGNSASLLVSLKTRLADLETASATEASHALLVTFIESLETLIGESLTQRLLGPVWAPPANVSAEESPS